MEERKADCLRVKALSINDFPRVASQLGAPRRILAGYGSTIVRSTSQAHQPIRSKFGIARFCGHKTYLPWVDTRTDCCVAKISTKGADIREP
ncbi:Hypothetical protein FNO222_0355 [Francisella orientalis]|uniref:Uncharacterized protein n=1 Tax=Francisella orientalis TaxID=299583 RepID=A0ABN4GXZ8_9GAMM|nr:hypothetical protein FNO12_0353 [Francisella orientalis FNO12]AKN86657.1 Hypothetical protein FNO24_0353 [Francisella orientalis FNO24]AKN88196.1 Hypothetical protein FNO190_0353 [Francisella orientalis]AKU04950.1 Hypothetical protein FNO01_0353 [Francisella orientalis]QEN19859.1 Hypothetical protein FNO39_0355 [Francisella orientalis]